MIAVIFEVEPAEGRAADYFSMAMQLKADVEQADGFISVERFESVTQPGKFVSLSFWRDEAALLNWRKHGRHQTMQKAGRGGVFADYRLRVASVVRDYGMFERGEAPEDAVALHG
ncbi:antibiotic biosynthesis monooxygenase family protein [Chenggangzhangella methanolivorans]|uniref:Antibiotic biosynthesis monooxygenase n=1 Tax=Chenggangzhangella methanolivorans TaxID=1437009 RepID=A0A9E6RBP6_9HYPH|nr:antibiotic biosynthesis monooxygenase [Chenggangzhangella methanolivorans]QZO01405.1 antibiotic biosynthesis monooxygenase [Chenggangzhangella methanolivorans]